MPGLEIAAGVIGITDVACKSLIGLYRFVRDIQDAPALVKEVEDELAALDKCLAEVVNIVADSEQSQGTKWQELGLAESVNACGTPCNQLRRDLERWTKAGGQALRTKIQVRAHKGRIDATLARIMAAKGTVDLAVGTATLRILMSQTTSAQDIVTKRRDLELKVEALAEDVQRKFRLAEEKAQELQVLYDEDDSFENEIAVTEANKEKEAYEQLWANCAVAVRQLTQQIGNVTSDESAQVRVGMSKESVKDVQQQTIGHVKSGKSANVMVGIF